MTEQQLSLVRRRHDQQAAARHRRRGADHPLRRREREIRVDLDPARMESYGITAGEVNDQFCAS